jgi:uncharacterized protein YceK
MVEGRIRTIVLAVALLLLMSVPAFVQTRGDGTPTHTTATSVGANETDIAQPDGTPKTALADATRDTGDDPRVTPENEAANESRIAQSDETPKTDSTEATPNISGTFFTPGNIVVAVTGCGVYGGTCATTPVGGTGSGGTYGDDQASPWTLFQYTPNGASSVTYVNSLDLPQAYLVRTLPFPMITDLSRRARYSFPATAHT